MEILLKRWCESRPGHRVLCGCLCALILAMAAWGALIRPLHVQRAALRLQIAETAGTNVSLWPTARRVPRQAIAPDVQTQPFSPLDFQAEGCRLERWTPQHSGGELTLDAEWQAIPTVFARLAQRDVQVSAFTLSPQGKALRLHVQLEHHHAK